MPTLHALHSHRAGSGIAAAALLLAACQSLATGRPVRSYSAEEFFATTSVSGASFSADGSRLLVTSDASGIFNAYSLPVSGGAMTQLTFSTTDAVFAQGWFPHDDRFLYTADQGGNELNHLFVRELDGTAVDLTPGENLKAEFRGWSGDDRAFFVATNERDPRYFDLYRYQAGDGAFEAGAGGFRRYGRTLLFQNPGGFDLSGVTRDGRWVALTRVRNNADNDLFLAPTDRPGAPLLLVTPHGGDVDHAVMDFSPDGGTLYYRSDEGSEFQQVHAYDLASGAVETVYSADWDVSYYGFSRDGHFLIAAVNADARTRLQLFDAVSGAEIALPEFPTGDLAGLTIEPAGSRMAFFVNGDASPANLYVHELGGKEAPQRLTDTLNPAIDPADLVEAEMVHYASFDGLAIPAVLYRPHRASGAHPVPAVVWVHGGPGGQSRGGYSAAIQHLVNHGYAVLAVNNRGSSGYGKTFHHLDDRRHGDVDLQDCVWGRRYLESLAWVDGDRVGILGGSYGGYMVCAALAFEPEAFDVGIDIFGVTNWLRTLESIPPWWEDFRAALYAEMGDPTTDQERLRGNSPLFHAGEIRKPMLVVQGANDPRVLQVESDEMVAAVRANGVPVEYLLFPDEGHGFRSRANRIAASDAYVAFLDKYLRGSPSR
ncbi:MAG TPA: alpha/beta fold hydrolase [Planctomycetota bacterium]